MTNNKNAIILKELCFGYDDAFLMNKLEVGIPNQSITALLGPNGSGKTTLIHILVGLLKPMSGEIHINGKRREEYSSRDLKQLVSLVPQNENIPFDLSIMEYVLLGRAPHLGLLEQPGIEDRNIADTAIKTANISSFMDRSVPSLSGGERQMATIARALAQETEILLLDEPTSHLDIANTRHILNLMKILKKNGKTILFTTHDPNAAAAVADHIILMKSGRILKAGHMRDVLTSNNLSKTYDIEVEIINSRTRPVVLSL